MDKNATIYRAEMKTDGYKFFLYFHFNGTNTQVETNEKGLMSVLREEIFKTCTVKDGFICWNI